MAIETVGITDLDPSYLAYTSGFYDINRVETDSRVTRKSNFLSNPYSGASPDAKVLTVQDIRERYRLWPESLTKKYCNSCIAMQSKKYLFLEVGPNANRWRSRWKR